MIRSKDIFHAMREEEIENNYMAINATNNGSAPRELVPAGNYIARCYQMIEIGTVKETILGKEQILHKVRIGWELPTELKVFDTAKGEQPLVVNKEYTLSMHEKSNMRKDLKSWRGKDFTEEQAKSFDITQLIGVPCMINIIHKPSKDGSRFYEEIAGITPMPKGVECPEAINRPFVLSYDSFDVELFNMLPDFIKNKMVTSLEYEAVKNPHTKQFSQEEPIKEDDLPF